MDNTEPQKTEVARSQFRFCSLRSAVPWWILPFSAWCLVGLIHGRGTSRGTRRYAHALPFFLVPQRLTSMPMACGHGGLGQQGCVGLLGALGVGHLDVVGLVPGHELVAGDAVGHGVHDRPLRGGRLPAALGLLRGQLRRRRRGRGPSSAGRLRRRCATRRSRRAWRCP